jgi:hypothetical protein
VAEAADIKAIIWKHWNNRNGQTLEERFTSTADEIAQALARRDGVEGPVGDVIEGVRNAIKGLRAHVSAIQADKRVGANAGSIYNCINDLPNIIRQLEAAELEIEAEFERYEDAHPAPTAPGDGGGLTADDHAVIRRCTERQPKLFMRGQHEGYYVHSDVSDLIDIIGRLAALRQPDTADPDEPLTADRTAPWVPATAEERDHVRRTTAPTPSTAEDASMAGGEECPDCDTSGRCTFVCEPTPADPRPDPLEALREAREALVYYSKAEAYGRRLILNVEVMYDRGKKARETLTRINAVMGEAG